MEIIRRNEYWIYFAAGTKRYRNTRVQGKAREQRKIVGRNEEYHGEGKGKGKGKREGDRKREAKRERKAKGKGKREGEQERSVCANWKCKRVSFGDY